MRSICPAGADRRRMIKSVFEEVGTGSREENASKQKTRARSDSIGTGLATASYFGKRPIM
jgi:hypothetical protein